MSDNIVDHVHTAMWANSFRSDDQQTMARAAIRATLEYARDHVSENMRIDGEDAYFDHRHSLTGEALDSSFRAMLSALLKECEGGEG